MISTAVAPAQPPSRLKQFCRKRVLGLILAQLTQGVTPRKIALTIALGFILGVFPILGSTIALCAIAGFFLKLNQPIIQLINWIVYPLQLSLILVFVRIGEKIMGAPQVPFSIPELLQRFGQSPKKFMVDFGRTGLHGIVAWCLMAPLAAFVIYFLLLPPLKKLAQRIKQHGR